MIKLLKLGILIQCYYVRYSKNIQVNICFLVVNEYYVHRDKSKSKTGDEIDDDSGGDDAVDDDKNKNHEIMTMEIERSNNNHEIDDYYKHL